MKKLSAPFRLNVGSSFVLVVFVVLCLVTFATLSIVSAAANEKASRRTMERTTAYYTACNQAEDILGQVDESLQNAEQEAGVCLENAERALQQISGMQVAVQGDSLFASYAVMMSDTQRLEVELLVNDENDPDC